MKNTIWKWLLCFDLALAFLAPRAAFGQDPCTAARINDFYDSGCHQTPGGAGAPPSGAGNAGGNTAYCPTCEDANGMPRWWVDEPYINLHVVDEPLSYTTSSGQKMAFRFNYKQRFANPGLDQVPSQVIQGSYNRITCDPYVYPMREAYYQGDPINLKGMTNASWSHNWMMNIVFWDAAYEQTRNQTEFHSSYEAFEFGPDGGISYFTYNAGNGTLNPQTQTNDPISQVQMVILCYSNYPVPNSDGVYFGNSTNGVKLIYPDGSQDIFGLLATVPSYDYYQPGPAITTGDALLTERIDPQGRVTKLGYQCLTNFNGLVLNCFRLRYVVDTDGRTNTFQYASSTASPWLLQEIDDPFGRKTTFTYNASNWLASITDSAGNSNSFTYITQNFNNYCNPPGGWLQYLGTPYGTATFTYDQVMDPNAPTNYEERATYVSEPGGAQQLFAYIHNTTGETEATHASPAVPGIVFDDGTTGATEEALYHRNSFHWERVQTANLSTNFSYALLQHPGTLSGAMTVLSGNDLNKATMSHWLLGADNISLTETLSSTRDPSTDPGGQIEGEWNWCGYGNSTNAYTETTSQIAAVAKSLPDGTVQFASYQYYPSGLVSANAQTFSKPDGTLGVLTNWFQYAGNGFDVCCTSNSVGQSNTMTYNNCHQVTSVTDALNQKSTNVYDSTTHNLTSALLTSGQSFAFAYFPSNTSGHLYNTNSFLNTITVQPEGLTTTISDYTNGMPRVVQISGTSLNTLLVSNTWDNLRRLTGTQFPDGTAISNVYTNLDLIAHTDRLGNTTHFVYDNLDHLHYITNALTNVTTLDWCNCGSLTGIIDALTNSTTLSYDNQEHLTNVLFADGSSMSSQYDLLGRLTNQIDGTGKSITYAYNNQGLVTAVSNAYGQVIGVAYDAVNRAATITNADGVVVNRTYDLLNRLIRNTWPDNSTEQFQYSSNGLVALTNQDAQVTHFGRDGSRRLTAITNNLLETNQFIYDALDRLVSLNDARGNNTSWAYNQYGWLTSKSASGSSVFTNGFDANGQLAARWMPASGISAYKWNALGNLTNITYPQRTNTYAYDAVCRLTNMLDSFGTNLLTTSFTWTQSGQLASETSPWASDTISFLYSQGRRTNLALTQPVGTWNQSYAYDAAWRLQTLSSPAGQFGYGYSSVNPASTLFRTLSLPNAASITNYYDSLARLDYTALLNYWGHPLDGYNYQNDSWGLRTNITRQLGLTTNIVSANYDGIGELASWTAKEFSGTARQNEQLGYAYDLANNLQYRTNGAMVQTFNVNSLNEISNVARIGTFTVTGATPAPAASVTVNGVAAQTNGDFTFAGTNNSLINGSNTFTIISHNVYGLAVTNTVTVNLPTNVTFQYDANGNLTNDGTRSFSYDAENQLTNVSVSGGWQVAFLYDGMNRRRIERDFTWTNSAWVQTNETRFIYDGLQVIQERDTNNNPQVTYTRGLDKSMSLSGAGGIGGMLARNDANGSTYYHSDGNGNVTALMDGNEIIVARYEYDGFGRLIAEWGTMASPNKIRISSMPYNDIAGLSLYPLRAYEPNFQRWLSRDPVGEAGGMNLYGFSGNNPLNWIDPYGDVWYKPWTWGLFDWVGNLVYSSAYAQHQGQQEMQKLLLAHDYANEAEFAALNPRHNVNSLTEGDVQAVQATANGAAAATETYINLAQAIVPAGIAAKEAEEALQAARLGESCPKQTPWGWTGGKPWKDAARVLASPGTYENINGTIPTLEEAMELLQEAGVDLNSPEVRLEEGHPYPNPHDYPHINYPAPNGGKGTIRIQP